MGTEARSPSIQDEVVQEEVATQEDGGRDTTLGRVRRTAFKVVAILSTLFILAMFNVVLLLIVVSWFPAQMYVGLIGEPAAELIPHRLHDSILPILAWSLLIGVGLQVRRPKVRQAPLLMAVAVPVIFAAVELATGSFAVMDSLPLYVVFGLLMMLHPQALEAIRIRRLDKLMTALTAAAAAAWLPFAYEQARLQPLAVAGDDHAAKGHWVRMAVFAILVVVWALLGSSDRPGWRITAWVTGLASAWYGFQSLIFGGASAAAWPWAIGAVVWGAAFIIAAEMRARAGHGAASESESGAAGRAA
ncbi:MAG: hypothetical protein R3191_01840 [Anaerolineales bacterium]|nr:hypothetical protein [Anaerolineales bacterium]